MFTNQKVQSVQLWQGQTICFEPDSSPQAWQHYQTYYLKDKTCTLGEYGFENLFYYNGYAKVGLASGFKQEQNATVLTYVNVPCQNKDFQNRLFALASGTTLAQHNRITYCEASSRLSGECDFNFNDKKIPLFQTIILQNSTAQQKLETCKKYHHTLLNFSLMQSIGNMQKVKGADWFDRLDVFVYKLSCYFSGRSTAVIDAPCVNKQNREGLILYLKGFADIYDYMQRVYFITSKSLVDKIIEQGKLPMQTCDDAVRYMDLAIEFWQAKQTCFLKNEFLTIGSYFQNGGEVYTFDALQAKLQNDLGLSAIESAQLMKISMKQGFLYECSQNVFTR